MKDYTSQYFGLWCVEMAWFGRAFAAVKAGLLKSAGHAAWHEPCGQPGAEVVRVKDADGYVVYSYEVADGVAIIPILGQTQKGDSSLGGTSTVRVRQAIRDAVARQDVIAILLLIESPGGTVAGTAELAADVKAANAKKPVYTQFEDLGASAVYWAGSQARKVYANATALVGSLGTVLYVDDTSGAYDLAQVKAYAFATGEFKAAGADGLPITEAQQKYFQDLVNQLNVHFKAGVMEGRNMDRKTVDEIFDGRVHVAAAAKKLGLIDGIQGTEQTLAMIRDKHGRRRSGKADATIAAMGKAITPR